MSDSSITYIVNFPTKRHWRGASRIEDIRSGLRDLRRFLQERGIHSIAIPPLGAGLGGLDWSDVKAVIVAELDGLDDVDIRVFEPLGAPGATEMVKNRKVPKMTPGRAAMVERMRRYLDGLLDPFVTLLEISPYGLELLSTVHWVVTREGAESLEETVSKIHSWNPRKQQFTPRQIKIALQNLSAGGWINPFL